MKTIDIGRVFICFLVICCLLINISPFRAHAMSAAVTVTVIGVGVAVATAIAFQALGVRQGSDPTAFQTLVTECSSALSADWAVNGLVNMLAVNDGILTKTYASQNFMQSVLDWLLGNDVVTASSGVDPSCISNYDELLVQYDVWISYPYRLFVHSSGTGTNQHWQFLCSDSPFVISTYDEDELKIIFGTTGGYILSSSGDQVYERFVAAGNWYRFYSAYESFGDAFSTSYDLTLEAVGTDIETDYDTYVDEGIIPVDFGMQFEDNPSTERDESENNNQPWLPATIPSLNIGDYSDQTQADAQSGLTSGTIIDELISSTPGVDVEPGSIPEWLSKIWDTIIGLPAAIAQAIAQVLADIFVPSSDFVTAKVEAIQARFDWITPIIDFAKSFQSAISGSEPPIIYVHLQNYEGPYNFGGTVKFLDMTWYSRYKSQGDAIISGFLWALLGWRLFMKLPGIINGAGGAVGVISYGRGKDE